MKLWHTQLMKLHESAVLSAFLFSRYPPLLLIDQFISYLYLFNIVVTKSCSDSTFHWHASVRRIRNLLLPVLIHVSADSFASAKSSIPCFPHNNSLPEIKSACFEKEGMRRGVEGSTLHYITAHQYLTVGIICKYFIKLHISSSLCLKVHSWEDLQVITHTC